MGLIWIHSPKSIRDPLIVESPIDSISLPLRVGKNGQILNVVYPHMLRHTFVDNWLRNGGAEVDLARLAGWTTTRMAERYAQHRADERAVTAHKSIAPLDSLT
jgi:integrase